MRILRCVLLATALLDVIAGNAQKVATQGAPAAFHTLVDQYLDQVYLPSSPTGATALGLHQYDAQLEDYSPASLQKQIAGNQAFERRFAAIDPATLPPSVAGDREMILNSIRNTLLTLQTIQPFATNPDTYSSGITGSAFTIMERPYAPADVRLKALIAREKLMPHLLEEARTNLQNPPHIYTEIAIEQIDGNISFFEHDVPAAFTEARDAQTKAEFQKTNAAVIAALKDYAVFLRTDLLPRSNGDFKLGPAVFQKKLLYSEDVDLPLARLLTIAIDDLHRNQAEFARIAKEVDPSKTPTEVLAELATVHPAPDKLLKTFGDQFTSLIGFINTDHIITIPSKVEPTLEETPPFERATTQASMDPPGPFETHSKKAYFNVTLPDPRWDAQRTNDYMAAFNVGTITSTAVHEAYPGHYIQFLWQDRFPSKVRQVFGVSTNIEGWAHYCEQMMLDQGYLPPGVAAGSKDAKLIRLGQLQDALLRDARFVVVLRMHTGAGGAMTTAQAVNFFVHEGYQARPVAEVETKRSTSDIDLYYTLGKLMILKLRADVKVKQGPSFNLQQFHDTFMQQGPAPLKIIRKSMLGNDSPTL